MFTSAVQTPYGVSRAWPPTGIATLLDFLYYTAQNGEWHQSHRNLGRSSLIAEDSLRATIVAIRHLLRIGHRIFTTQEAVLPLAKKATDRPGLRRNPGRKKSRTIAVWVAANCGNPIDQRLLKKSRSAFRSCFGMFWNLDREAAASPSWALIAASMFWALPSCMKNWR